MSRSRIQCTRGVKESRRKRRTGRRRDIPPSPLLPAAQRRPLPPGGLRSVRGSVGAFCARHRWLVRDRARDRPHARRGGLLAHARRAEARAPRGSPRGPRGGDRRGRRLGRRGLRPARRRARRDCTAASTCSSTPPASAIAGTIADTSTKAWDLQQAVNLRGAFLVTRAALPHLRAAKGYVVNLASIAGTIPTPGLGAYGASKAALIALTRTLDREEADDGRARDRHLPGVRRHADGRVDRDPGRGDDRPGGLRRDRARPAAPLARLRGFRSS